MAYNDAIEMLLETYSALWDGGDGYELKPKDHLIQLTSRTGGFVLANFPEAAFSAASRFPAFLPVSLTLP